MDVLVKRRYPNYKQHGSFSGAIGFKNDSKLKASLAKIKQSLKYIPSYTLHHPVITRFARRRVYVSGMHTQYCMDLKDIQTLSRFNNRRRFLLVVIDAFSKQAWLEAIPNKTGPVVVNALKRILERSGGVPSKIQVDEGTEFLNKHMNAFLKSKGIDLF